MKVVEFANGTYAIRKFSLSRMYWVYLDLYYADSFIQGTLTSSSSVTMWRTTADHSSDDCFSNDFEKVYHIYKKFTQCAKEKKQQPYKVVKVYNEEEVELKHQHQTENNKFTFHSRHNIMFLSTSK